MQHKEFYSVYRVYLTPGRVTVYIIDNVQDKYQNNIIRSMPVNYRVDFGNSAVDSQIG